MLKLFVARLSAFSRDRRGNIALMTGLLAVPLVAAVGLGVDYSRAASTRQQLDSAAQTAATQAIGVARATINAQAGSASNGDDNNTTSTALQSGQSAATTTMATLASAVTAGAAAQSSVSVTRTGQTITASVTFSASVPTTFSQIVGLQKIPVSDTVTQTGSIMDQPAPTNGMIVSEDFENIAGGGVVNFVQNYDGWVTPNNSCGGVEIDTGVTFGATPASGKYFAELDSSCNIWMSKKVFLPVGSYELRYFYMSRIYESDFDPAYVCSSKASDIDTISTQYPNDTTNRLGVYLDPALSNTPPWSPNGTLSWQTNNAVDSCLASGRRWIERSVTINITTPGYYWLTFQGEGASDSLGPLIDNIRLCTGTCPGTVQEDYPWTAGQQLFSDDFDGGVTPGTLYISEYFTRGLDYGSGYNYGWSQLPNSWYTLPDPTLRINVGHAPDGTNSIALSQASGESVNTISRSFLLDPGYYQLTYKYAPPFSLNGVSTTYCGSSQAAANIPGLKALGPWTNAQGHYLYDGAASSYSGPSDDFVNSVYLDDQLSVGHPTGPVDSTTWPGFYDPNGVFVGWGTNDSTNNYRMIYSLPQGTYKSYPIVGQNLIDVCGYAPGWTTRTVNFEIQKPGFYWLTFQATNSNLGMISGQFANVRLTALGGLSTPAPANLLTIPAHGPAAGTPIYLTNLSVASQ